MKRIGVIGYPLGHSLSPAFQQASLDQLGLGVRYEAWETPAEGLAEAGEAMRSLDCLGANVTIPHKDDIDELSRQVGAVNTVNRADMLHGYNTDVIGFLRALKEDAHAFAGRYRLNELGQPLPMDPDEVTVSPQVTPGAGGNGHRGATPP